MSAPQLTIYVNSPIAVGGDQLNTFMQTCDTAAQMRAVIGTAGVSLFARGISTAGDGSGGPFYWNSTSIGPDDNLNTIVPPGAKVGAWLRLPISLSSGYINVLNVGAVGNGTTDDSFAIQAAINKCFAGGGGIVFCPPTGHAYFIATGLNLLGGVSLMGAATRTFAGTEGTIAQWTAVGSWIQSGDTVNPAVTISGHGSNIIGLNFIYPQPIPGGSFAPTQWPWTIALNPAGGGGDLCNLEDILIHGAYNAINWSYPSANGGGTGVNWRNLMIGAFHRGIFTDNVNDVMCWDNVHVRNLYYDQTPSVVTYLETNLVGWDCHYTDNPMIKGLEFFQCFTALLLSDGTCLGITHSLFNAILTDVQHFGGFFVAVGTATVHSSVHITNGLFQTDTTNSAIASPMFELVSDNIDWSLSNINVFAGGIVASVGNGTAGRLQIDGMKAQWGATAAGQTALSIQTGAELSLGSRTMIKLDGGTSIAGGGADQINTPHNWSWSPYSAANQVSYTSTGTGVVTGFSLQNDFNPITAKKLQARVRGQLNVATAVAGTATVSLGNFTEIVASGISVAATGLVGFDSGWIDLSSASAIIGTVTLSATTGAVIQNADLTVMLR